MTEKTIGELPLATVVNNDDLLEIEQSGVSKRAPSSLIGSYFSNNTARVDPRGDDDTGMVGDITKPFLTAQAATTALEAGGPYSASYPATLLFPFKDTFEDITTSLQYFAIIGTGGTGAQNPAIGSVVLTSNGEGAPDIGVYLILKDIYVGNVSAPNVSVIGSPFLIRLSEAVLSGDITTSQQLEIECHSNTGSATGNISPGAGNELHIRGLRGSIGDQNGATINASGSDVYLVESYIDVVTAAGTISMQDSVIRENDSGVAPVQSDFFINPANFDFSTLPTNDPQIAGRAWMNSGVFTISVGPPP